MMQPYRTVLTEDSDEHVVMKSRFIGSACPCGSEEAALAFLDSIRNRYRDARHHCYAYIIGANRGIMRYSDDGEPQGTAGLPIIETMKSMDVTDACVVVTRYFGGTLLGTGGLTRAYRKGCQLALEKSGIVEMRPVTDIRVSLPYTYWNRVQRASGAWKLMDTLFTEDVTVTVRSLSEKTDATLQELLSLTDGSIRIIKKEEGFQPWETEEHPQ